MITIDQVDSEVVVDGRGTTAPPASPDPEAERARLREVVRELLREELGRFLRTRVEGGWR